MKKLIIDIFKTVDFFRSNGEVNTIEIENFEKNLDIKKNKKDIYELIEFFENYIINFHLYVYDILSQELFMKLLRTKKVNGLDIQLEEKLEEIKKKSQNPLLIEKIDYIKDNIYKINTIKKLKELIELLKSMKVSDLSELENLYFMIEKLKIIKKNKFTEKDLTEICNFTKKFDIRGKDIVIKSIEELHNDKININKINKLYKSEMENLLQNNTLDEIIFYLDSIKS